MRWICRQLGYEVTSDHQIVRHAQGAVDEALADTRLVVVLSARRE